MAYINKRSAKRKHRKYRRRSKKGGVITLVFNPKQPRASIKSQSTNKEVDEAQAIKAVANDYTRSALENAISVFSRQAPEPVINLTTTSKRRPQNKRDGPTASQIEKAEQKALKKALKEQEKALKKELKEKEKAEKEQNKLHTKVAKDVTKSAIAQAFSSMFGKGTGPKSRRRK